VSPIHIPHRYGTLDTPMRRAASVRRDHVAVIDGDIKLSYGELDRRIAGARAGLRQLGLESGDRVGGLALNSFRHLEACMGVPTTNLVLNDLNFRLAIPELEFIVNDSGARVLLADERHWETAIALADNCDCIEQLVWLSDGPSPDGEATWDELCAATPPDHLPADLDADCVAGITYTGGTTGLPKGVMQTHGNLMANAKHLLWANPVYPDDRFLHITPMFHSAGVANIYVLTMVGGTHVICPGFEPDLVGRLIERYEITVCVLVPTMINMFLNHPGTSDRDLSSWRLCIYAASPMPVALLRRALAELPCDFVQGYGMTEACPHVAQLSALDHRLGLTGDADALARLASCGTPCIGVDVEIRRPDDTRCEVGEIGEIVVRGPNVMPGYWNRPEETAQAFTPDGWYRSGDLASVDDGGYIFIVDRAKDMIVSGGENIYTTEVENVLATHPAVLEVAVFGVPHEQWGEAVHAEVCIRHGADVTEAALVAHCRQSIGGFKVPRSIALREDPLPKSGAGKILKREIRSRYWEGFDRNVT
jgi:long-chain acyl-CoA synthetase